MPKKEFLIDNKIKGIKRNMIVNIKKLPKKIRTMNKKELVEFVSKKLKLEYDFLNKLELEEIQYLLIQIDKYGENLSLGGVLVGGLLF